MAVAPGSRPDVEEDVAPGRIAEGRGHRGHGGAEPAVVCVRPAAAGSAVIGAVLTVGSLPRDQPFQLG